MKINSSRMKIFVLAVLVSGIAASTAFAGVMLVGPRVTQINVSEFMASPYYDSAMRMSGQVVYGTMNGTNYGGTIAAKVSGVVAESATAGAKATRVSKWVALALPGATAAKLGRVAIEAGLMVGSAYLGDWAAEKGLQWLNGKLQKQGATTYYRDSSISADPATCSVFEGGNFAYFPDSASAVAAGGRTTIDSCGASNWYGHYRASDNTFCLYPPPGHGNWITSNGGGWADMTSAETETALSDSMKGGTGQANAKRIIDEAIGQLGGPLQKGNQEWPNNPTGGNYSPLTPSHGSSVQQSFDNSITNDITNTIINEGDTQITNNQVITDQSAAGDAKQLTKADVQSAVKGGLDDAAGESTGDLTPPPVESNPDVPDEEPIPTVLNTFWDAIRSLPVVSLLTGISLTASGGDPVVAFDIPRFFTEGSVSVSMNFNSDGIMGVNYGYYLGLIGNVLLAFCGIRWTMYLFQSGD